MTEKCAAFLMVALFVVCPEGAASQATRHGAMPHGDRLLHFLIAEQLEFRLSDGEELLRWEVEGFVGGDLHKLWLRTEGEHRTSRAAGGEAEVQLLYGRSLTPFWDVRFGIRQDLAFGPETDRGRAFAAVGFRGHAPYGFDLTPEVFFSDDGDLSLRLTAARDVRITRRAILEPRLEIEGAASSADEFGIGSGLSELELGLRLRYEWKREFAPYVGAHWYQLMGGTEDAARRSGEERRAFSLVAGFRFWF